MKKLRDFVLIRYLVKELFLYFFITFLFFFVIFFFNNILVLAETILKQRVSVGMVMKLIWYSLPGVIAQSAPFATLVGFLMCLGRLVSDNEILILRASGLEYAIIMLPVVLLGIVISIGSFFMNDYLLPIGTLKFNRLKKEIVHTNPAVELESNSIKRTNDSTLALGEVDALFAKSVMLNVFTSAFIYKSNRTAPREMTSFDLYKELKKMEKSEDTSPRILNNYKVEYNKKFSIPFGSFFFALLAMPLALIFGKRSGQTIGAIIGLFISLVYWTLTFLGQAFGMKIGLSGFWAMWTPNLVIGLIGITLYIKLLKK